MWHSAKTIWKRNVPVETHPHDECSSGHRVPVKLTRKASFPIYGCANASAGATHAARFLYLRCLTAFPAAERWENTAEILWFGFSSECCPTQAKPCTPSSCDPPAGGMHSPAVPRQHLELPSCRFFHWGNKSKQVTPEYAGWPKEAFGNPWWSYT